ncbi:MAG TPA: hypothetical protein VHC22_12790 [Pirellulales bacterium]|nr:hypothetical protein [Pirellulales bacterium]
MQIDLAEAAEVDLIVTADWYDRQAPGLGNSFISQVDAILDQLMHYPEMYQIIFDPVRRAVLRQFPFGVIYHVRPASVEVLGIMPCRADPKLLMRRIASARRL